MFHSMRCFLFFFHGMSVSTICCSSQYIGLTARCLCLVVILCYCVTAQLERMMRSMRQVTTSTENMPSTPSLLPSPPSSTMDKHIKKENDPYFSTFDSIDRNSTEHYDHHAENNGKKNSPTSNHTRNNTLRDGDSAGDNDDHKKRMTDKVLAFEFRSFLLLCCKSLHVRYMWIYTLMRGGLYIHSSVDIASLTNLLQ